MAASSPSKLVSVHSLWVFLLILQLPVGYVLLLAERKLVEELLAGPLQMEMGLSEPPQPPKRIRLETPKFRHMNTPPEISKDRSDETKSMATSVSQINETPSTALTAPETEKPKLYIHIGPSKTGTSTIQRESSYWEDILEKDQYFYLGKFASTKYRSPAKIPILLDEDDCFQEAANAYKTHRTPFRQTPCWADKIKGLDQHLHRRDTIVLSDEAYSYRNFYDNKSDRFFPMLRIALQDWNVIVVPTYRRYHEWYLSGVKEVNRKNCLRDTSKAGQWPSRGGTACKNIWHPLSKMIHSDGWPGVQSYSTLEKSIPYWQEAGFTIQILNFHSSKHLTCAFYCDLIPDAPHTCQFCLSQKGTNQNPSPAALTAYDDIVFEAARQGMLQPASETETRAQAVSKLIHYHTQTLKRKGLSDLPLICPPNEELELLLQKSLQMEQKLQTNHRFLHGNDHDDEEQHKTEFWKLAHEQRIFCWVDKDALLDGKQSWTEVIDALQATTTWPVKTATQ